MHLKGRNGAAACTPPPQVDDDLTVLQLEKDLRLSVETLLKEKGERVKEMRSLQQQDGELCEELCATPYYIPTGSLPSRSQLQELRLHIKQLSEEKVLPHPVGGRCCSF